MKKRLLGAFAAACLCALLPVAAARAQGSHTLEGRVSLPNGSQPAQPVRVTLTYNGRRLYETFTDLSGRFTFKGLGSGRYQLTAAGDDRTFETTSVAADVTGFGPSAQNFTQNIQLRPKAGSREAPAASVSVEELDPGVPERAREKYRQALKSAAEEKAERAVELFREAVKEHPSFYAAHLALAEQLGKRQQYEEALAAYRRAGELKPDRAEPYVGVGVTLVNQKRYEEGIRMLRGVVEVDREVAAPYLSLGYAEMMVGDYKAAEEHLLRASELGRNPVAHVYLANVYEQTGETAKALARLELYLKESPESANAASVRGAAEKLRKKLKEKK
jgi:tetratricopeptide (TPR) repeat protein